MQAAVAARDVTTIFRLLQKVGMPQQRIAALTGQSQPEVSAIMHGRKVMSYDVLLRITDGLGIPRGMAGMSSCRCQHPPATDPHTPAGDLRPAAGGQVPAFGALHPLVGSQDGAAPDGQATPTGGATTRQQGGAGELAIRTAIGLMRLPVDSVQPLPENALRKYLTEGRTIAVIGLVELAHSHLPGLDTQTARGIGTLAEVPTLAQITGADPTPPPVVLLTGAMAACLPARTQAG
jgi:hypothetical protein